MDRRLDDRLRDVRPRQTGLDRAQPHHRQYHLVGAIPAAAAPDQLSPRGERIDYDRDGSIYRVSDGERAKIVDFDSRNHERPSLVTWSPDGEWLLLRYKDELWIVKRDGSVRGTLAKTRPWPQEASWWIDGHGYLPRLDLRPTDGTFPPGR